MPDQDIFPSIAWDRSILEERLRETAFLTQGLEISLYDLRRDPAGEATCPVTAWSRTFCFQNGLKDFVSWLEQDGDCLLYTSPQHAEVFLYNGVIGYMGKGSCRPDDDGPVLLQADAF